MSVSINKVSLAIATLACLRIAYGWLHLHYRLEQLSSCDKGHLACKAKNIYCLAFTGKVCWPLT